VENVMGTERRNGFTLIELMIALVVITLVVGGYIGANVRAQRNTEEMHERTVAIQDANRVIEQMRDVSKTGTFPANVVAVYPHNSQVTGISNLTDEVITVTYTGAVTDNPLIATITVTWLSYPVRTCSETVQTYITQR